MIFVLGIKDPNIEVFHFITFKDPYLLFHLQGPRSKEPKIDLFKEFKEEKELTKGHA